MKETKTTTPPTWVEEMQKWQKENPNDRAVLCIAADKEESACVLYGKILPLIASLLSAMIKDSAWVDVCKGALIAKENPIAAFALMFALEECKKESKTSTKEEKKTSAKSPLGDLLKILTKLANKL